jgi:hypothetical protein
VFTARSRQNPFANRRRQQREAAESEQETAAILDDPGTMAAIAEAEAELVPNAVPHDTRDASSDDITDAPDISTYAASGFVESSTETEEVQIERNESVIPLTGLSPETQAKIDAVMNHAIPPLNVDERVDEQHAEAREKLADALDVPVEVITPLKDREESKRGRGRPRPQETIERDNAVHALLVGADADTGISKESIAAELGEKEQQVYSSLRQLTKEGRAETRYVKPHGYRWFAL